jgi:hypothetical protein
MSFYRLVKIKITSYSTTFNCFIGNKMDMNNLKGELEALIDSNNELHRVFAELVMSKRMLQNKVTELEVRFNAHEKLAAEFALKTTAGILAIGVHLGIDKEEELRN